MNGEDSFQMVWQPVTHFLKAEWAEGWQGALSQVERNVLGNSSLGHSLCLCKAWGKFVKAQCDTQSGGSFV